jgi:hypothetical protein
LRGELRRNQQRHVTLEVQRSTKIRTIDKLCAEYVYLKRQRPFDGQQKRLRDLEIEVEALDTQLCGSVSQVVGCVLFYYRLGYNSAETAAELRMKPPCVRVTLLRLRQTAEAMAKNPNFVQAAKQRQVDALVAGRRSVRDEEMAAMRAQGKTYKEIARHFGITTPARVIILLQKAGLFKPHCVQPTQGFTEPKLPCAEMFKVENGHGQSGTNRNGHRETPEYSAWRSISARQNPKHKKYSAGIKLHPRWQSFVAFLFDMGVKPHPNARLTRKDKAGHWEPANCAWVVPPTKLP